MANHNDLRSIVTSAQYVRQVPGSMKVGGVTLRIEMLPPSEPPGCRFDVDLPLPHSIEHFQSWITSVAAVVEEQYAGRFDGHTRPALRVTLLNFLLADAFDAHLIAMEKSAAMAMEEGLNVLLQSRSK